MLCLLDKPGGSARPLLDPNALSPDGTTAVSLADVSNDGSMLAYATSDSGSDFEVGSPDDPEEYQWLRGYSPLHHVRPGTCYPATLLLTGDHDDRVVPGHSFKFAAALQAAQAGEEPILIRVDAATGHGAGKPTAKAIAADTDVLTFLAAALPR